MTTDFKIGEKIFLEGDCWLPEEGKIGFALISATVLRVSAASMTVELESGEKLRMKYKLIGHNIDGYFTSKLTAVKEDDRDNAKKRALVEEGSQATWAPHPVSFWIEA